jgi:hypothetical protein
VHAHASTANIFILLTVICHLIVQREVIVSFHCNNVYAKAQQCYVIPTLLVLFFSIPPLTFANKQIVGLNKDDVQDIFVCRYFRLQGSRHSRTELSPFDTLSCCKVRLVCFPHALTLDLCHSLHFFFTFFDGRAAQCGSSPP